MIKYKPRLTNADMPANDNKYYIRKADGGYSPCIKGYPQHKHLTTLSNCVGWAIGRMMEILQVQTSPLLPLNAEDFYNSASLAKGQTPKNGAVICWRKGKLWNGNDGAGHVAVVEKVISDTEIITSESAYGGRAFYTKTRKKGNGNWGAGAAYTLMGFIYPPEECVPDEGTTVIPDEKVPTVSKPGALKVGDVIDFKGGYHYSSSMASKPVGGKRTAGKAKITTLAKSAKHPYHLIGESGGSNVYGWVDADTIKGVALPSSPAVGDTPLNIPGVDISYCQQGLDYEKLKADGIKFAIIRASYTGTESHKQSADSLLNRHVKGCIAQGIDYGFYHYSCAVSVEEARKEAQFCVEQIKNYPLPKYPVFFDAEEMQIANKGKTTATDIALAFVDEVENLGYPSGIYVNPSWMECYLEKNRIINNKDIWLAHWVSESSYQYGQKMWQNGLRYSAGMNIDSDICFVNYPQETSEWYKAHGKQPQEGAQEGAQKKSMDEIIDEIWNGLWGCGQQRYDDLTAAGYDYYAIQDEINRRVKEQEKASANTIKVGSKVMVKSGAKTYSGGSLASFVYTRPHTVTEIIRDRAVICYGSVVVAAVNVKDLTLV